MLMLSMLSTSGASWSVISGLVEDPGSLGFRV